jgi:hypothetical protein
MLKIKSAADFITTQPHPLGTAGELCGRHRHALDCAGLPPQRNQRISEGLLLVVLPFTCYTGGILTFTGSGRQLPSLGFLRATPKWWGYASARVPESRPMVA